MIYLACPYSHPDPAVREARFRVANAAAAVLMGRGEAVFSPISHSHPIAVQCGLPGDFDFWRDFDEAMIAASSSLAVVMLDGWRESRGVTAEIEMAEKRGMPVEYIDPSACCTRRT